jgi:GntR family transcriptional repressor for pyruvate dehydrogenase complex
MPFAPVKRRKVAEQIADTIRDAILGGELDPGESLPSERDLAGRFSVNRSSVREALLRLEALDLVEVRHGGGTRVTDFLATAGLQVLPFLLAPGGELDPALLTDLLDLRVALLGFTADRAARNATPEGVARLAAAAAHLEQATTPDQIQARDFDFFLCLVSLSQNRVLGLLANAIRKIYDQNLPLFQQLYGDGLDAKHHHATVDAVGRGHQADARAAMEAFGSTALGGAP